MSESETTKLFFDKRLWLSSGKPGNGNKEFCKWQDLRTVVSSVLPVAVKGHLNWWKSSATKHRGNSGSRNLDDILEQFDWACFPLQSTRRTIDCFTGVQLQLPGLLRHLSFKQRPCYVMLETMLLITSRFLRVYVWLQLGVRSSIA